MSKIGNNGFAASRTEPKESLDDFPTPPWATRALIEYVLKPETAYTQMRRKMRGDLAGPSLRHMWAWEPCCNRGDMVRPLQEAFGAVMATDIVAYDGYRAGPDLTGPAFLSGAVDFLGDDALAWGAANSVDWIITNPPFIHAEAFIARCRELSPSRGFAMLVRTGFVEGMARFQNIFCTNAPTIIAQFAERVVIHKGGVKDPARRYPVVKEDGTVAMRKPSTQAAYCWMVWLRDHPRANETQFVWIPPCREALERPGDYGLPEAAVEGSDV